MATRQKNTAAIGSADQTIIGPEISIKGRVEGEEDLRIEGRIDGEVRLSETLYVEGDGIVVAEVEARDVVVTGVIVGNVTATNSVTLSPGAKLVGDITAPRLIISDGAGFRGNVRMTSEAPARPRERSRSTSTPAASTQSRAPRAAAGTIQRPAPRRAASRSAPPPPSPAEDDEITVVVKHAALGGSEGGQKSGESRQSGRAPGRKRKTPRARVPARGKRKAVRR